MDKVQKVEKLFTSRQSFSKSVRVTRKKYASDLFSGRHEPVFYYVYVPPVKLGMASYVPRIYIYTIISDVVVSFGLSLFVFDFFFL